MKLNGFSSTCSRGLKHLYGHRAAHLAWTWPLWIIKMVLVKVDRREHLCMHDFITSGVFGAIDT